MDTNAPLPANVRSVLREADAALLRLAGESHHLLYQFLHRTAARIAPTDSFYLGFYCEGEMMVFPYSYDGVTYYDPNKFAYRPDGLAAWMLQNQRAYTFSQDGGELLGKGKSYGQTEKRSQDAVAVPILEDEGRKRKRVTGILSIQSYEPAAYGAEVVPALEWLARGLVIVLERERADAARREALRGPEEFVQEPMLRPDNVVNQMLDKMAVIRRRGEALLALVDAPRPDLVRAVEELCDECRRRQTETIELFLDSVLTGNTPLAQLSDQERRVVALLTEGFAASPRGYTNSQLADRLGLAEDTVKTHLRSVFRKLGVSGRTGVVALARPYLHRPTAS